VAETAEALHAWVDDVWTPEESRQTIEGEVLTEFDVTWLPPTPENPGFRSM